jgi:glycerol-3-phosphate dehydrogenase
LWNLRHLLASESGLHPAWIEHLLERYGSLVHELLDLVASDPSLGEPLDGAPEYLRVEVLYAVTCEGARHLDDVLARRTRVSIETFDRGVAAMEEVARLMGQALDWSEQQRAVEVEHYRKRVEAELESQQMPDDETADAARLGAADVVPLS